MKKKFIAALLLSSSLSYAGIELIGGVPAGPNQFRTTVLVNHACTASKIGSRTFLFASHCMVDMTLARVRDTFLPGSRVEIHTHYGERAVLTIKNAYAHESFLQVLKQRLDFHQNTSGGAFISFDIAAFTVLEATPNIPVANVDFQRVQNGDKVVIGGYGCQTSVSSSNEDSGTYKISNSTVMPNSVVSADNIGRDISRANSFNFYSAGQSLSGASICPGDSGGPVYRTINNAVVGVNSQYIYINNSGISFVNTHTRISEVSNWLRALVK